METGNGLLPKNVVREPEAARPWGDTGSRSQGEGSSTTNFLGQDRKKPGRVGP